MSKRSASTTFRPPSKMTAKARRAYYEGVHGSAARSMLPGFVQEAKKDLTRATRRELIRNSRALHKNNPMARAVIERLVTYVIGTGIFHEPASSSPEWNRKASAWLRNRLRRIDVTGQLSFQVVQQILCRSLLIDGEVFTLKTHDDAGANAIQILEADTCGTREAVFSANWNDGIDVSKAGAPLRYWFEDRSTPGAYFSTARPASDVLHLSNNERANQGRGVPLVAAALTTAIDLHDILAIEKYAVKDASSKVDIIATENGEAPIQKPQIGGSKFKQAGVSEVDTAAYYQKVFGPESKVIKRGDSYTPYEPKRPGPAWQGFVDFLAELVCLSFNLPPSLVRQLKVGGVDTRRDLAIMQRVVEVTQLLISDTWQGIHEYFLQEGIDSGELAGAPSDWNKSEPLFPRAATADAGKMAQQDREDVRTGNMTLREACGQYSVLWQQHVNQLGVEMSEVMKSEERHGLPPGSLVSRIYGAQTVDRIKQMRDELDAYGVGVRAGVLTPNAEDEKFFRAKFGLPVMSADVLAAWQKDGNVRKPITLASQTLTDAEAGAAGAKPEPAIKFQGNTQPDPQS